MRDGKYKAREAVIRMKMKLLDSGNPYMWDTAAYRIASEDKSAHARTGDKWKIYPTYDFAHCLCDALEGITHSLCTMEFQTARESYNWLVDELKEHLPAIPQQRECECLRPLTSKDTLTDITQIRPPQHNRHRPLQTQNPFPRL